MDINELQIQWRQCSKIYHGLPGWESTADCIDKCREIYDICSQSDMPPIGEITHLKNACRQVLECYCETPGHRDKKKCSSALENCRSQAHTCLSLNINGLQDICEQCIQLCDREHASL